MVRIFVLPAPTSVALSWSMATTRESPSFSPTNSVLPLIKTEGRLGLNTMACSLSGGGLGGGGGAIAAELVTSLSCSLATGGLAGVVERSHRQRFATFGDRRRAEAMVAAGGLGWAAAATTAGEGVAGCGAIVGCAAAG